MATKANVTMDELLAAEESNPIVLGDTIDGVVRGGFRPPIEGRRQSLRFSS